MLKSILLSSVLCGQVALLTGCATKKQNPAFSETGLKQLRDAVDRFLSANSDGGVVLISTPLTNGLAKNGTGVLVSTDTSFYIVTAAHVATNCNPGTMVIFRGSNETAIASPLNEFQAVHPGYQFATYANGPADCAILPFGIGRLLKTRLAQELRYSTFTRVETLERAPTADLRKREMTVTGFPLAIGALKSFQPPSIRGRAASELIVTVAHGQTARTFLLDIPGVQGMSGGPVSLVSDLEFRKTGEDTATAKRDNLIVGILVGTLPDDTGGKLAVVSHVQGVLELIRGFESQFSRFVAVQP